MKRHIFFFKVKIWCVHLVLALAIAACTKENEDPIAEAPIIEQPIDEQPKDQHPKDSTDGAKVLDILGKLDSIEGISAIELEAVDHFERLFEIKFLQPIDHSNPSSGNFEQKIFLGHVGEDSPVVFETEGYAREKHRTRELAPLLNCNQIAVEHRYFGKSVPDPFNWKYLDVWQAANDHHKIVEVFKVLYPGSWVSSGASKGGDAAIFHRRFFPEDVNATVAYVAPILLEQHDTRFLDYYNSQGDELCREKMKQFQRNILIKLDSMPDLFHAYVKSVGDYGDATRFSLGYKNIIYHATRKDYAFEFWSSETEDCSTIPGDNATAQELFNHFVGVFDVFLFFSDWGAKFWTPYSYQALTELGNYAYDVSHLEDLTLDIPPLVKFDVATDFDASVMADIQSWLNTSASQMVFIYGEQDPWTVAAVDDPVSDENLKIINPDTKHGTRLETLSSSNRQLVLDKLNEWMSN
jgi:hypothetical protein